MKVLITGAHFTPAQAVIEELKKDPTVEIIYVGRKSTLEGDNTQSVESRVLPSLGVKFIPITAGRFNRYFSFWSIVSFLKIPIGFIQAFWIMLKEQPDVILSFGGYVAFPVVFWGWWFSVPVLVHEQTLVSGLSNYLSSFFASKIAVSFDKKYPYKREKLILTGNPIRRELSEIKNSHNLKRDNLPLIYITGGNQGSHIINKTVEDILKDLIKVANIFHQTGESKFKDFESLSEEKEGLEYKNRYTIKKWFGQKELAQILNQADLVICRSGVNTLSELAHFGVPAITIPLPGLFNDEQKVNAKFFEKAGLCRVIYQSELTGRNLFEVVKDSLRKQSSLKKKAENAKKIIIKDAAPKLLQETLALANTHV